MTNDTDSFVQEVDQSLREDRLLTALKRYGPALLVAFAIFLVGLIGWEVWGNYQRDVAHQRADQYIAAQEMARQGNMDGAKAEFERLSQDGPRSYRVMARMERAAILENQGDLEGALAEFDAAANAASDPLMRETAQLRAAYIAAETQDFPAIQTRLRPLTESNTRISFLARELLAVQAWKAGQTDLARDTLQTLSLAFDAPEGVRQRAQLALSVLGPAPETAAEGAANAPAPSEGETK